MIAEQAEACDAQIKSQIGPILKCVFILGWNSSQSYLSSRSVSNL
jgi:hypothetical protein